MKNIFQICIFALIFMLYTGTAIAITPHIVGPDMKIVDNNIIVSLSVSNVDELESVINSGIGKEIAFTIELLRVWNFWPDEFVVSKKIVKIIKYDNLREQYLVSSNDGINQINDKYDNYNTVKGWLFSTANINLANIKELEASNYYIRVVVESKSMEQPPFLGLLMHFIPEVEMSLAKESRPFTVEGAE